MYIEKNKMKKPQLHDYKYDTIDGFNIDEYESALKTYLEHQFKQNGTFDDDAAPTQIESDKIDWTSLCEEVQQYIDFIDSDDYHEDNDYDVYIAESAIKTIFGENVYEWINKRQQ